MKEFMVVMLLASPCFAEINQDIQAIFAYQDKHSEAMAQYVAKNAPPVSQRMEPDSQTTTADLDKIASYLVNLAPPITYEPMRDIDKRLLAEKIRGRQ